MKTCLGSLLLVPVIIALVVTVVYHTSVNAELQFEQRDTNAQYINTARSYRPQIKEQPKTQPARKPEATQKPAAPAGAVPGLLDDDIAEEV
ncbi:MAG: hypothetical protein IKA23_09640 [Akkermansia sp.]|nr:hypothetical protein [Akkermansia sp.]MBR2314301.1 hypothetical protein [Akkermansia sp.]